VSPTMERKRGKAITAEAVEAARRELGLGETATREDVRRAYRRLARRWHPDLRPAEAGGARGERFKAVLEAYALLTDYMAGYRYSFRPDDVRRDQEDPLERRRRQFGRDASWDF